MNTEIKYLTKEEVKAGRRFHHKESFRSIEYTFSKHVGKGLFLRKGSHKYIGEVTQIFEDAFMLSVWILDQETTVLIPYSECILIEPQK